MKLKNKNVFCWVRVFYSAQNTKSILKYLSGSKWLQVVFVCFDVVTVHKHNMRKIYNVFFSPVEQASHNTQKI